MACVGPVPLLRLSVRSGAASPPQPRLAPACLRWRSFRRVFCAVRVVPTRRLRHKRRLRAAVLRRPLRLSGCSDAAAPPQEGRATSQPATSQPARRANRLLSAVWVVPTRPVWHNSCGRTPNTPNYGGGWGEEYGSLGVRGLPPALYFPCGEFCIVGTPGFGCVLVFVFPCGGFVSLYVVCGVCRDDFGPFCELVGR